MRTILTLAGIVFIFSTSFCQENYSKAKIYTKDNKSIDCYIKNSLYEGTPQKFSYALTNGGTLIQITVGEIKKVEFDDGTVYETHSINVPVIKESYLNRKTYDYEGPDNHFSGDALLEKLISGPVSLYQFVDKFDYPHFFYFINSDPDIVFIPYKTYLDDNGVIQYDNSFKNLLVFLVQKNNCSASLSREVDRMQYTLNPMLNFFKRLNACAGQTVEVSNPIYRHAAKIRFGVMGGISLTSLNYTIINPAFYPGLSENDFPNSVMPVFGIYIDFIPRKKIKNYVATLEAHYQSYKQETDSIHANSYTAGKGFIKFSSVNVGPSIRFHLTRKKINPFLEGGINLSFVTTLDDYYQYKASGTTYTTPIFSNKGVGFDAMAGGGVDFGKASVHIRYQFPLVQSTSYFNVLYAAVKVNLSK